MVLRVRGRREGGFVGALRAGGPRAHVASRLGRAVGTLSPGRGGGFIALVGSGLLSCCVVAMAWVGVV